MPVNSITTNGPVETYSASAPETKSDAAPITQQPLETKSNVSLAEQNFSAQNLKLKLNQVYDQKETISSAKSSIPAYDPAIGPQITNSMWTPEMLTEPYSSDLLRNIIDPAGFLNARVAAVNIPRNTNVVNGMDTALVAETYARFPREIADQMISADMQSVRYLQNSASSSNNAGNSSTPLINQSSTFINQTNSNSAVSANNVKKSQASNAPLKSNIPAYDPKIGPQITNTMWTPELLGADLTPDLLRNMIDPAGFLNARVAQLLTPTNAKVVDMIGGTAPQSLNPLELSSREQAESMLARLKELGYNGPGITENKLDGVYYQYNYGDETRRTYQIGGMNVGLLANLYARFSPETVSQMIAQELNKS